MRTNNFTSWYQSVAVHRCKPLVAIEVTWQRTKAWETQRCGGNKCWRNATAFQWAWLQSHWILNYNKRSYCASIGLVSSSCVLHSERDCVCVCKCAWVCVYECVWYFFRSFFLFVHEFISIDFTLCFAFHHFIRSVQHILARFRLFELIYVDLAYDYW